MKPFKIIYCIVFSLLLYTASMAQSKPTKSSKAPEYNILGRKSITRDTLNRFPDSVFIKGKMVDYTLQGCACGVICGCGTIKIKLSENNPHYKAAFIYVAIPCFEKMEETYLKAQSWKLYKLPLNEKSCFWQEHPTNKFHTKGLPFYTLEKY